MGSGACSPISPLPDLCASLGKRQSALDERIASGEFRPFRGNHHERIADYHRSRRLWKAGTKSATREDERSFTISLAASDIAPTPRTGTGAGASATTARSPTRCLRAPPAAAPTIRSPPRGPACRCGHGSDAAARWAEADGLLSMGLLPGAPTATARSRWTHRRESLKPDVPSGCTERTCRARRAEPKVPSQRCRAQRAERQGAEPDVPSPTCRARRAEPKTSSPTCGAQGAEPDAASPRCRGQGPEPDAPRPRCRARRASNAPCPATAKVGERVSPPRLEARGRERPGGGAAGVPRNGSGRARIAAGWVSCRRRSLWGWRCFRCRCPGSRTKLSRRGRLCRCSWRLRRLLRFRTGLRCRSRSW